MKHHLKPDRILLVDLRDSRALPQQRVQVFPVTLQFREPRVVVETPAAPCHLRVRHAEVLRKLARSPLHAVAKTDDLQVAGSERGEGQDRHRVGVVHDHGVGRDALGVGDDLEPFGSGAKRLEDAAGPNRVADALVHAVTLGDLVVVADVLQAGDLDRVDDVVAPFEHIEPLGRRLDGPLLSRQVDQAGRDAFCQVEAPRIDVDQREHPLVETIHGQDVGDELAGEDSAPGADERHLRHRHSGTRFPEVI